MFIHGAIIPAIIAKLTLIIAPSIAGFCGRVTGWILGQIPGLIPEIASLLGIPAGQVKLLQLL